MPPEDSLPEYGATLSRRTQPPHLPFQAPLVIASGLAGWHSTGMGAAVDPKVPSFTCTYCNQVARVTKAKGTVALSKLEDIANNTSVAVDKMALKRLDQELAIVHDRRHTDNG